MTRKRKIRAERRRADKASRLRYKMEQALWHPWIKKVHEASMKIWWIGGVCYPSNSALRELLGTNYLAVTGDGLLSLLFEVITLEGDGEVRYHNLQHKDEDALTKGYPSIFGSKLPARGIHHNHRMTFPELVQLVNGLVEEINSKVHPMLLTIRDERKL